MGRWEGLVMPALDVPLDLVEDAGNREHQGFLEVLLEALPLQGIGVLIEEVIKALCTLHWWEHLATVTDEHVWEVGLQLKVNLPIFKDEKTKDAVTYHSWWCNVAIFHWSGWDNQHLLSYIFHPFQGFPGDLALNLGKWYYSLSDILQMLEKHYGVIMMFDSLSKELYSLKQALGENIAEFGVHLSQQVWILQLEYPGRIQPKHMEGWSVTDSMRALILNTSECWLIW